MAFADWDTAPASPAPTRRIYGVVYELVLSGQRTDETSYVGKAKSMRARMAATGTGHRSPSSIAKDPWKAHILPGRAGYRILERVPATGDKHADEAALRRAESDWIDRRRPTYNDVRPVRPRVHEAQPRKRPARQQRARSRARRGWLTLLVVAVLYAIPLANVLSVVLAAWPIAPWIATPVIATMFAWSTVRAFFCFTRRVARGFR